MRGILGWRVLGPRGGGSKPLTSAACGPLDKVPTDLDGIDAGQLDYKTDVAAIDSFADTVKLPDAYIKPVGTIRGFVDDYASAAQDIGIPAGQPPLPDQVETLRKRRCISRTRPPASRTRCRRWTRGRPTPAGEACEQMSLRRDDASVTMWVRRAASAVAVKVLAATVAVVMVTALPTAASARRFTPRSGSYTGLAAGQQMTFWVAPGGRRMVNVALPAVVLSCVGGGAVGDHFGFATARIRPNGTFRTAGTQTGIANGVSSTYAYSFGGHFSRGGASGSFRMTISPTAGAVGHACTSNLQT